MKIFNLLLIPIFLLAIRNEPITPIPQTIKYNHQKALLGKKLFFDSIFSADKKISCASCHFPSKAGADPRPVSIGVYGKKGGIQSPPVYNAVFNFRQFWNGRAFDLKEQIDGPTHNPVEMSMNNNKIEEILNNNKKYKKLFYKVYQKNYITYNMFADAIAEFEKGLITPNCKFDKWLREEVELTKEEYEGYINFKRLGCINCHNGVNIGGNSFQKVGVIHPLKKGWEDRYKITKDSFDENVYKVPTLRNITLTAPYFHNGSKDSLSKAVDEMAYYNLGLNLTKKQIKTIVKFLETLTGETPKIMEKQ
jgi:cytochrome c peroxidase